MTRARDRLIVCGRTPGNIGKKVAEEGSWWDRARRAFDQPEIAEKARPLEEPAGLRFGPDPENALAGAAGYGGLEFLPGWTARALKPEAAGGSVKPSGGVAPGAAAPSPLARQAGLGRFRRGDLIHKLLELLPDLEPAARERAAHAYLGKQRDLNDEQREEMASAALAVLADQRFAAVFGLGSRAEAAVAGAAPGLKRPVSGRVDRLVVEDDRVLVVDFKTNRPAPETIEDADPAYLEQMAVYVAVLRAVFPDKRAEAALLWTDGPRLMPVPEAVIDRTLAALASG
jgi:ATP-dependent helicase/nuclease subunit A